MSDLLEGLGLEAGPVTVAGPAAAVLNNPAAALVDVGPERLADSLGAAWDRTPPTHRPAVVARRCLRRALDPDVPLDLP